MSITSNNTNVFAETVSGGGGGGGTPASSVVSQTSYSLSAAVGTSTDYARADHAHGTPAPIPGPSNARCMFGQASIYNSSGGVQAVEFGAAMSTAFDTTYTVINQKVFANGRGWTAQWYTLASIVPYAEYVICISGDMTYHALYAGFDSTGGYTDIGSQGIATDQAFFYFDSANIVGMTNFFLVTTDSIGGVTSIDTGVTVVADTEYKLKIQFTTPTTVVASINDVVVATSTTNTPGVSVLMNHGVFSPIDNVRFNRMYAQEGI